MPLSTAECIHLCAAPHMQGYGPGNIVSGTVSAQRSDGPAVGALLTLNAGVDGVLIHTGPSGTVNGTGVGTFTFSLPAQVLCSKWACRCCDGAVSVPSGYVYVCVSRLTRASGSCPSP